MKTITWRKKYNEKLLKKIIWWVMQKLGIGEWKIRFVKAMYTDAASSDCIYFIFSEKFGIKVRVHQGSVLSPLMFVIVMDALSHAVDMDAHGNYYM